MERNGNIRSSSNSNSSTRKKRQPTKTGIKTKGIVWMASLLLCCIVFAYGWKWINNAPKPKAEKVKAAKTEVAESVDKTNSDDPEEYAFASVEYLQEPAQVAGEQLIRHKTYSLQYNEPYEQASWVAYILRQCDVKVYAERENDRFIPDKKVLEGSAHPNDYKSSGFDRGHLVPAADRKGSEAAQKETFLMSNVTPQRPNCNRGIWEELESKVRSWVKFRVPKVYVCTGPIFTRGMKNIGYNQVAVPESFYKIVLRADVPKGPSIIGFIIPNDAADRPLSAYVASVDEIEKLTNLDFFPKLPDNIEDSLERSNNFRSWFSK